MGKKKRANLIVMDFDFIVKGVIPATQEAFHSDDYNIKSRKQEKESLQKFREPFLETLLDKLKDKTDFPTQNDVYIYIQQFFVSNKEYRRRDVDNMANTILYLFKNNFI